MVSRAQYGFALDEPNLRGQTPLMIAAERGFTPYVQFLFSEGAKASRKDTAGNTALHYAEKNSHSECSALLRSAR